MKCIGIIVSMVLSRVCVFLFLLIFEEYKKLVIDSMSVMLLRFL